MTLSHQAQLEELAERCEKATGPDRYVDYWAAFYCGFQHTIHCEHPNAPPFTSSLDAAMWLVPEGSEVRLDSTGWYTVVNGETGSGDTPALALTAASLRAISKATGEA